MKHYIYLQVFLLLGHTALYSQDFGSHKAADTGYIAVQIKDEPRFYANIHGGYAFALGSTFKFYPDDVRSITVTQLDNDPASKTTVYKAPSKGLGQGFRLGAGFSYIINDFINVGLDADYFRSVISKLRDSSYSQIRSDGPQSGGYNYSERYTISYDATILTFTPNIVFKAVSRPKFFIYNKVGAVFTFRPNSLQKESTVATFRKMEQGVSSDSTGRSGKTYDWGIKNPSIGFMGGVGAQVKLTERIRIFGEIQFSHIVFVIRSRTLTSYTMNGNELVKTLPVMDRELKFERDLSSTEITANPDQPMRTIIQRIPITYVGGQIGIACRF